MQDCDVMTKDVGTFAPDTPLEEVVRLLVERRVSGVPVVAEVLRQAMWLQDRGRVR